MNKIVTEIDHFIRLCFVPIGFIIALVAIVLGFIFGIIMTLPEIIKEKMHSYRK